MEISNNEARHVMRMNEVFKALADPARRCILQRLRGGEKTAGELAEACGLSKPTASHHFGVLRSADLIASRREGQNIYYSLNTTAVEDLLTLVVGLFARSSDDGKERKK
jgi:DNA-binding transcriptional ArsR family regulator